MDNYTSTTKKFLEDRFNRERNNNNIYLSHQPIFGYRSPFSTPPHIQRYIVIKSILNAIKNYSFSNLIDVGGAEGWTAHIIKELFKVKVATADLSENACKIARKAFNHTATACDIHLLPFQDSEFDVVICSETIEHVTHYKQAVDELLRITKNVLIITVPHETPKKVAKTIRNKMPHGHIHYFDINTLDYLKERGYIVKYEKTSSPLLTQLRVMIEGYKKTENKIHYKIYNALTPIFKKLFGIKSAHWIVSFDKIITNFFGLYGGITFAIEKRDCVKSFVHKEISSEDFIGITVTPHAVVD